MGLVPRRTALGVVTCAVATLVSGCIAEGPVLPTAAEVAPVIRERGAVAQEYWTAAQAFQRARLGFKVRLEVAGGQFVGCSPGSPGSSDSAGDQDGFAGGEQYQIFATWLPVGVPPADQGGLLQEAVPVVERAFDRVGWGPFEPSTWSALDVVATRRGSALSLDAHPANPWPLERDWTPAESFTVAGRCIPVTAQAATELGSAADDSYSTTPTPLPSVRVPTQ
jgi:hypothetical protein